MIRSCMALSQLLGKHSYKRPNATPKIDRLADLFSVLPPSVSVINQQVGLSSISTGAEAPLGA